MSVKTITGTAILKDGTPAIGTKVMLTTNTGKPLIGTGTGGANVDIDGKWSMKIPTISGTENRWIKANDITTGAFWNQKLDSNVSNYPIDFKHARGVQQLNEMVVVAKSSETECKEKGGHWNAVTKTCEFRSATKPEPKPEPKPKPDVKEKNWWQRNWFWVVPVTAIAVMTPFIIILAKKDKKSNKK